MAESITCMVIVEQSVACINRFDGGSDATKEEDQDGGWPIATVCVQVCWL
jgi:hypothetical protein